MNTTKFLCVAALFFIATLLCLMNVEAKKNRINYKPALKTLEARVQHQLKKHVLRNHKKFEAPKKQKKAFLALKKRFVHDEKNKVLNNNNNSTVVAMADKGRKNVDFNYLLLSLNWPGSACMSLKPCNGVTPKYVNFTIHGLWPNSEGGRGPESCGEKFDYNIVKSILPDLRFYWPDFKPDEPNFWKHEYEKHGNCAVQAGVVKNQLDYFVQTINIVKRLPIMLVLQSAGIVPSSTVTYNREKILDTIERSGIAGRPFMTCDSNKYVRELRFCFNKQLQPIACTQKSGGCSDAVILKPVA